LSAAALSVVLRSRGFGLVPPRAQKSGRNSSRNYSYRDCSGKTKGQKSSSGKCRRPKSSRRKKRAGKIRSATPKIARVVLRPVKDPRERLSAREKGRKKERRSKREEDEEEERQKIMHVRKRRKVLFRQDLAA